MVEAVQELIANINAMRSKLAKWGTPDTPILGGEIGGAYSNPGKRRWSIAQALYAAQVPGFQGSSGVRRRRRFGFVRSSV